MTVDAISWFFVIYHVLNCDLGLSVVWFQRLFRNTKFTVAGGRRIDIMNINEACVCVACAAVPVLDC